MIIIDQWVTEEEVKSFLEVCPVPVNSDIKWYPERQQFMSGIDMWKIAARGKTCALEGWVAATQVMHKKTLMQRVTDLYTGVVLNHVQGEVLHGKESECRAALMWAFGNQLSIITADKKWDVPMETFNTVEKATEFLYQNGVRA